MEDPLSSTDSPPRGLNEHEPAKDNTSCGLNEAVDFNTPQIIIEPAEESSPPKLNKQAEDSKPQDPNESVKFSKPEIINEPAEESKPQDPNESVKFSKPEIVNEPAEESKPQDLNEQARENSEPQDQPSQSLPNQVLNESAEDSKPQDLNHPVQDNIAQDPKNETKVEGDTLTFLDKEKSPLPSHTEGREITTTEVIPTPEPSLDVKVASLPLQYENGASRLNPSVQAAKRILHVGLPTSRPVLFRSPSVFAKAALRTKPKPQTADKSTQILPGRVPMFPKLWPKIVQPPRPKPPSADKATEISPSFEKLLKRPPPWVKKKKKKKKKKEETKPVIVTRACPKATSSPNVRRLVRSHRGRLPHAAASPPQRMKNTQSVPLHVKSTPLRMKFSSSSPSKHRLNLSLCPRKKRKIICNLYITFCDKWDKTEPCNTQQNRWKESLSSCSGLYRACCVFGVVKYGMIHVSNLLLALHTLDILVTCREMYHILRLVNVDEHGILNFTEFLEAVNTTSPFAETETFQNALKAFRRMKNGTVTVKELEPILLYLGIILSPETIQQTLGRTKVNKNGKFDISDFLLAARDLQRILEEEEEAFLNEYAISKRRPFQDVAGLVDAEYRRRRKYWDCLDEEMSTPTCLLPFLMQQKAAEDIDLGKQQIRTSSKDLRRSSIPSSVNIVKGEAKDRDAMEVKTSQMGLSSNLKSSSAEPLESNAEEENKDSDSPELEKSQVDIRSQNIQDPVPS